ncbi:MAG: hypothetical protein R3190_06765 [Thermoanaerobaculia bacterium]|nr:hypothetical protein [Thermoanaerobaculia bacterium]
MRDPAHRRRRERWPRRILIVGFVVLPILGWSRIERDDRPRLEPRTAVPGAAVRAVVDPETGRLTTDRDVIREVMRVRTPQVRGFEDRLRTSDEGLFQEVLPNGAVAVDLQGRFMSPMVVETEAETEVGAAAESGTSSPAASSSRAGVRR